MSLLSDERVLRLLRAELPPPDDQPSAVDLWPRVQDRIREGSHRPPSAVDWMLLAAAVVLCMLRPSAIELLLLHF